jgi:hypothetical protein
MEPAFLNKLSELLSIQQKRCGTTKEEMERVVNETLNRLMPNTCSEEEYMNKENKETLVEVSRKTTLEKAGKEKQACFSCIIFRM